MSSQDAYKKLASAIDICYYIGPKDAAEIEKACCPAPKAKIAPKTIKKTAKVEGSESS